MTPEFQALFRRGCRALAISRYAVAAGVFQRLVAMAPRHAPSHHRLGQAHFGLGEMERAVDHLRTAFRLGRNRRSLRALATLAPFDPRMTQERVLRIREAWCASLGARSRRPRREPPRPRARSTRGPLRVGYVSSFFHRDNWMKPVWGLIGHHDPACVEVHLFSDVPRSAVTSSRLDEHSIRFHDISGCDNGRAARLIAANGIDVLVDLNGFSKPSRLPLFLRRPAPLLVAWFNIFATTGMPCFDVLVGDEWVVRRDEERWFVETVVRLSMSYLTFEVAYPVPDVQPPPCLRNGFVTFGSLATLYKINARVIQAWAEILRRCPGSRLVLRNADLGDRCDREHTRRRLVAAGIAESRLTLLGPAPHHAFLKQYDAMDIALDTFPYSGGTTTSEAIWQGVPVLTFAGDRWISRTSASIVSNAGLGQFVARDLPGYVDAAVYWGSSPDAPRRLLDLRRTMRTALRRSSVCDCGRFARRMEEIYQSAYRSASARSGFPR